MVQFVNIETSILYQSFEHYLQLQNQLQHLQQWLPSASEVLAVVAVAAQEWEGLGVEHAAQLAVSMCWMSELVALCKHHYISYIFN